MKSIEKQIEKAIVKQQRIMRMKSLDGFTQQKHYGIFKGLRMALDIINKYNNRLNEQKQSG